MRKLFFLLLLMMPLLYGCSKDSESSEDDYFTLYITYHGREYVVPCTLDRKGNLVYLDEEFKALWDNVLSKNEHLITYLTGEYSFTYYDTVEEMMKDLGLKFIDQDSINNKAGACAQHSCRFVA